MLNNKKKINEEYFIQLETQLNELKQENKDLKEDVKTYKENVDKAITDDRQAINKLTKKVKQLIEDKE